MTTTLSPQQQTHVDRRLRSERYAWVATVRPDGRPHTSPVWFYWDGQHLYFGSQKGAVKLRNIAANPRVALSLPDPLDVVILEGEATLLEEGPEVERVMAGYAEKYADAMAALAMDPADRSDFQMVRVTPRKVLAWGGPEEAAPLVDGRPRRWLDFASLWRGETTVAQLAAGLTPDDLRELTNASVDAMLALIADCADEDVTFTPVDPDAYDPNATEEAELTLPWTLGHVVVHTTASAEEAAFLAAELARGVKHHGRSRYEVPWQTVTTVAQCRARLEESRRMRLASLDLWPAEPHLDNTYVPFDLAGEVNAVGAFLLGLAHDDDHLGQIAEIVRQAKAARGAGDTHAA